MKPEVKNLLRKHDYLTVVQSCGDGCLITYPHPKLTMPKHKRVTESFVIERGPKRVGVNVNATYLQNEQFVEIPQYAMRLFITEEMELCSRQLGISTDMVDYLDVSGNPLEGLNEVLDMPLSSEDLQKEGFLKKLFVEARVDDFNDEYVAVADTHNVGEGYQILLKYFSTTRNDSDE